MPMRMSLNRRKAWSPPGRVERVPALLAGVSDRPFGEGGSIVEHRLAQDLDLHLALDALDHPHQQVVRVVVGRRPRVARAVLVVVPFADRERVDDAQPALRRHPRRLYDVRAGDVAQASRHVQPVRPHSPAAGAAVEQRPEDRRRVEVRQAHPLDRAVVGEQRAGVAVRQEAVGGDRREGRVDARRRRASQRGCRRSPVAFLRAASWKRGPRHGPER